MKVCLAEIRPIVIVMVFADLISGFSYNTYSKIEFAPQETSSSNSYFGYSVMLRTGGKPKLIVGAPRDKLYHVTYATMKTTGAIHFCDIDLTSTSGKCVQQIFDKQGNTFTNMTYGKAFHHRKDNMHLGMTIDGYMYNNGSLVMCAPKWTNQYHNGHYLVNGMCYSLSNTVDKLDSSTVMLIPLIDESKQGFSPYSLRDIEKYGHITYFYAYGESGLSVRVTDDNKEILLGAPGIYVWKGSVVKYKIIKQTHSHDYYVKLAAPNTYFTPVIDDNAYFGYSVDYGHFASKIGILYVAGAPRGNNYKGEVYIFDFPMREKSSLVIMAKFQGSQIGEYFGSTIAAIDIDQDGLTDLLVGAPNYGESTRGDLGRVYVYMNHDDGNFEQQNAKIFGSYFDGAKFGTSIANIGDINEDGYTDVAIGAPYENYGQGAVYIYLGAADGLNPVYVQRIGGTKYLGFGISISRGLDIDDNNCKDIAIGAYLSGHVVILRCHPSVGITPKIDINPKELAINQSQFTAQICIDFKGSEEYMTEIEVKLLIDSEYQRAYLNTSSQASLTLGGSGNMTNCSIVLIDIKSTVLDFTNPIEIKLNYALRRDPLRDYNFCKTCTVIRPSGRRELIFQVPIAAGCGVDLVCRPDLKLMVKVLNSEPYIIGTSSVISLEIILRNHGEAAFLPEMKLTIPHRAPLHQIPSKCQLDTSTLICSFENPLQNKAEATVLLQFDASMLKASDEKLDFDITSSSRGEDLMPQDNNILFRLPLVTEANLNVSGNNGFDQHIRVDTSIDGQKNVLLIHSFEILNDGPTHLDSIKMIFFLPVIFLQDNAQNTVLNVFAPTASIATLNQEYLFCKPILGKFYEKDIGGRATDFDNFGNITSTEAEPSTTMSIIMEKEEVQNNTMDMNLVNSYIKDLPNSPENNFASPVVHFNCTNTNTVSCLMVECSGSGLNPGETGAQITFQMGLNVNNTAQLLKNDQLLAISSYVMVEYKHKLSSNMRTFTWARTIITKIAPSLTSIWIVLIALLIGIVILSTIIYGLHRVNFFRRTSKEQLELLKNQENSILDSDFEDM